MAAPDRTFYNMKRLHAVFAVSAAAMLAITVWMIAADHGREWKVYQRVFRDRVEPWLTEATVRQQESDEFAAREAELAAAVDRAGASAPERPLLNRFHEEIQRDAAGRDVRPPDFSPAEAAYAAVLAEPGGETRRRLLARLGEFVTSASLRRENADREARFRRAEFDEARTAFEAAIGEGLPQAKLDALGAKTQRLKEEVASLADKAQAAATHQETLAGILSEITRPEEAARQALADHRAGVDRLNRTLDRQRPSAARRALGLPLIDAFGRPLAVEQLWLPELTIDYNFRPVARFDRCTTCHQGIDKTLPGSPAEAAWLPESSVLVELATPAQAPQPEPTSDREPSDAALERTYGFSLAPSGILDPAAPTVAVVLPKTTAARGQLLPGDVIAKINDAAVTSPAEVEQRLLGELERGKPIRLEVRRGLPHPYRSHPRLDLYVGSQSPHPAGQFGCTICHDGQGSATEFKFASHTPNDPGQRAQWRKEHGWFRNPDWDFAMRPARFSQSNCLKCHHDVSDLEPSQRFLDPPAAKLVEGYHLVRQLGCFGCHEIKGVTESGRRIGPDLRLEPNEKGGSATEAQTPGTMRKVGPSLRGVGGKLDAAFIETWLAQPSAFRPETRMPQFFGMHEHLEGKSLDETKRFEAVELRAITAYLLAASQGVDPAPAPPGATEKPSAERGKRLFQLHGCLACHKHADFPEGRATQGPDLSRIGEKLTTPAGQKWLVSWIRDPVRHSPRTIMPNPLLGMEGKTDPAADIAAYLLEAGRKRGQPASAVRTIEESDLDALARLYLSKTYSASLAEKYLREGIPEAAAGQAQHDAAELIGPITQEKKVRYVGRRTIRKRGCFGCHDIPGFEDAQPIGPILTGWGRKQESLLAFEQVHRFLAEERKTTEGTEDAEGEEVRDQGFYREAIVGKRREGFLWQKLRAPRSFDYRKTENKSYNEQLLMGRFTLTDAQREAILTFVLGLVSEPPKEKYLPGTDARRRAIIEGRKVLDKYACAACHTLELERWTIDLDPEKFPGPTETTDYPFLKPQLSRAAVETSGRSDRRGLCRAELVGMPQWNAEGKLEETEDEEGKPQYAFNLWEPAAIGGKVWPVGGAGVLVSQGQIVGKRPPRGGDFARLLYPVVLREAKSSGSTATVLEAWGWVPPALAHEGRIVQPAWLYDYLLEPYVVRPAAVLRMPKYNLSAAEAQALVDYFAAAAGAEFPYSSDPRARMARLETETARQSPRLDRAMRFLTDRTTYCAKCHLVGDYGPGGESRTVLAPNLERVARRIRPEYLRRWLANPRSVLPYTAMPVNFPPDKQMGQDLYPGASLEQLDAVTDLLLNYDGYLKGRASIRRMAEEEKSGKTAK